MLGRDYFDWLCSRVAPIGYSQVMAKLAETNYIWQFDLDKNRAMAGLNLRIEFSEEAGIYQSDVAEGPCSCLEMMIALAGNMVDQSGAENERVFFQDFLSNMGLMKFDDRHYNDVKVTQAIKRWLDRRYDPDGVGNILITHQNIDMRRLDTWQQMAVFINEFYPLDMNFLHD